MSMKYDFTTILNREGTGAIAVSKIPFDNAEIKEGFSKIPMWVADMNYAIVHKALCKYNVFKFNTLQS